MYAYIRHISPSEKQTFQYALQIELQNKTKIPLQKKEQYLFAIYPFSHLPLFQWATYYHGHPIGFGETPDIAFGSDGRTLRVVFEKNPELTQLNKNPVGFSYSKKVIPIGVQYMIETEKSLTPEQFVVKYVHYGNKWGKDLSWTKDIPVTLK